MCIETDFSIFARGRCMLLVELSARKLLEVITEEPPDLQRYLDKIDDLREDYMIHLGAILDLAARKVNIAEYRETARRIEAILEDCREQLLKKNCVKMEVSGAFDEEFNFLPKFGGELYQWMSFRKVFEDYVVNNRSLTAEQKMAIFVRKVSSRIGKAFPPSCTFRSQWHALKREFDEELTKYHLNGLQQLQTNPKEPLEAQIEAVIYRSQTHLDGLSKLGYKYDPSKIPASDTWLNGRLPRCFYCCRAHVLRFCEKFLQLDFAERCKVVTIHQLCINCFSARHKTAACDVILKCFHCKGAHNKLLHPEDNDPEKLQELKKLGSKDSSKV